MLCMTGMDVIIVQLEEPRKVARHLSVWHLLSQLFLLIVCTKRTVMDLVAVVVQCRRIWPCLVHPEISKKIQDSTLYLIFGRIYKI